MISRKHTRSWSAHQIAKAQKYLADEAKRREARKALARARAIVICKRFNLQPAELARLITARGPDKGPRKAYVRRWTKKGAKKAVADYAKQASSAQKPQRGVTGKKAAKPTVIAPSPGGRKKDSARANGAALVH